MQRVGESELGHGMFERDVDPADKTISPVEKALQNSSEDMSIENEMLLERLAGLYNRIQFWLFDIKRCINHC